jgi:hypothetical protein
VSNNKKHNNPLFVFNIRNNTPGNVPVSIMASGNPYNVVGARTRYEWNVSSVTYSPSVFTLQFKPTSTAAIQTFSGSAGNITELLMALNALRIGPFWQEVISGQTYVVTYNDVFVYGNLVIGTAGSQWTTTGGLQINNVGIANASITVTDTTTGTMLASSGGVIIPPTLIAYVWNLTYTTLQLANGDTLQCQIAANPGGPYNISVIIKQDGVIIVNTNAVTNLLSVNFTYNLNSVYDFTAVAN